MRKFLKQFLVLALCLCMALGGTVSAFAAGDGDTLTASKSASGWEYKVDEATGIGYWMLKAVYCENPTQGYQVPNNQDQDTSNITKVHDIQNLIVYAPESYMTRNADGTVAVNPNGAVVSSTGVIYTAENAPILYHNLSGGYSASTTEDVRMDYLQEGYVHVSVETRGSKTVNAAGEYIGQFPAIMVDLKAAVSFLKANDAVLPGNSERIVSRGFSSGGAVAAMLGASGNSAWFESGLKEIGAADAGDDIFIALASAPITNLSSADASYEWYQHANEEYFLFNAMAFDREGNDISDVLPVGMQNFHALGDNVLGGAHEDELSDLLYDWFVGYVQDMGFDLGDDGRSGSFYDGFTQIYSDALTEFVARYDELKGPLSSPRAPLPDTAEEYLASLEKNGDWFDYNPATGKVTISSLDGMVYHYLNRGKMCPSLDSYNYKSNENGAFKDAEGNTVHFSATVRDALKELIDNKSAYGWTDDELAYIQVLYEDYDAGINDASSEMLEIMSPINYVVGKEGFEADIAPYWRLRVGSADGDHGAPAAWLIAQGLEKYTDADVSVGIAWSMGHSLSELTEQDMYDYIADIMVKEDGLDRLDLNQFDGAWQYKVDEDTGIAYWMLDAVYCQNPVADIQHLAVYAPAAYMTRTADGKVVKDSSATVYSSNGVKYTADTAPILYHNTSSGYAASKIESEFLADYIPEGYVYVSIATRGSNSQDAAGSFIGQFPAVVVDLKAGVRFLKAFDSVLPGNSERIVSRGVSSGGAVSAMLGASGNSPIFDSYLDEIGAYNTSDDIFIAVAAAPITNLDSADASYEWFQKANDEYYLFDRMAVDREGNKLENFPVGKNNYHALGDNVLGGAHEDEMSEVLYNWFVDYVRDLGFDLGEDGRSGSFYEDFLQLYSDSLTEFIARYDELKGPMSDPRNQFPDTVEEYLDQIQTDENWFTYNPATGKATIASLDALMSNYLDRNKMSPSLDSYNYMSNEGAAFVTADGTRLHFSATVRDALKTLIDNKDAYGWSEEELAYIQVLYSDYEQDITDASTEMLEIMSPINYVVGKEGYNADIAPYWRLRVGSADGDHGAPAAWLIAEGLREHTDANVTMGIAWSMGHTLAELSNQDLFDYIDAVMLENDPLDQANIPFQDISTGDWFWNDAAYAYEAGLINGTNAAGTVFDPAVTINRAMVVTVLYRLEGEPAAGSAAAFTDVSASDYYAQAVAWAASNGITQGRPDGTFAPLEAVNRQDLAAFLYNYASFKGADAAAAEALVGSSAADSVQRSELAAILHSLADVVNG